METEVKQSSKKRIMFISGEDFYFLTYNSLLLLHSFDCASEEGAFHDHRKLAYLVDFVADPRLTSILLRTGKGEVLNPFDRQLLANAYGKGANRTPLLTRLSHALEKQDIIRVREDIRNRCLDFWLTDKMKSNALFSDEMFKSELSNIAKLRQVYNRVRTASLETMLKNLFQHRGVQTWRA